MNKDRCTAKCDELRVTGDHKIIGHAAVFNQKSLDLGGFREIIQPGAFRDAIPRSDVRFLINHDGLALARTKNGTLNLKEDRIGLAIEAELDPNDPDVQRLLPKIRRGDIDQMSFGFHIENRQKDERWNFQDGENIRTIVRVAEIFDVSPVTFPAYQQTDLSMRSYFEQKIEEIKQNHQSVMERVLARRKRLEQIY